MNRTCLPTSRCTVNVSQFTSGFHNLVLEMAFSDSTYCIARIPHQATDDSFGISTLSEIATMKVIRNHTTILIPKVFDFETSADQPFGYPYVFTEYLVVRTLPDGLGAVHPPQTPRESRRAARESFRRASESDIQPHRASLVRRRCRATG